MSTRVSSDGLDALAVTADDCRVLAVLFGFYDTAEFQAFAHR